MERGGRDGGVISPGVRSMRSRQRLPSATSSIALPHEDVVCAFVIPRNDLCAIRILQPALLAGGARDAFPPGSGARGESEDESFEVAAAGRYAAGTRQGRRIWLVRRAEKIGRLAE